MATFTRDIIMKDPSQTIEISKWKMVINSGFRIEISALKIGMAQLTKAYLITNTSKDEVVSKINNSVKV